VLGRLTPGQQGLGREVDGDRVNGGPDDANTVASLGRSLRRGTARHNPHVMPLLGKFARERFDVAAQTADDQRWVLPRKHQHSHGGTVARRPGTTLSDVSRPRPRTPAALIAGAILVAAGLGCWALYVKQTGNGGHSYDRGGSPASSVRLVAGETYTISIHGGVDREVELGLDPAALQCTAALGGQVPGALDIVAQSRDSKATNEIASFVSSIRGDVQIQCGGVGAVYVDDAEDAPFDSSGVWLVLASLALVIGLPLTLSGLRRPAGEARELDDVTDVDRVDPSAESVL
jgi:hypothetical protein